MKGLGSKSEREMLVYFSSLVHARWLHVGKLPDDWRAATPGHPQTAQSALGRDGNLALVRNLVGLENEDLSLRLTADGAADVAWASRLRPMVLR